LSQPRFVQFVRGLSLAYVAVASCQRLAQESGPYESCRELRGLFPGVPLLGLVDNHLSEGERARIKEALALSITDKAPRNQAALTSQVVEQDVFAVSEVSVVPEVPVVREVPTPLLPQAPPQSKVVPQHYQSAFVRFEQELSIADAAKALDRDEAWVWQALAAFILHGGGPSRDDQSASPHLRASGYGGRGRDSRRPRRAGQSKW
jgi:hypothetical protein